MSNRFSKNCIGTLEITGDQVIVADPRDKKEDLEFSVINVVKPGIYKAYAFDTTDVLEPVNNKSTALLCILHESVGSGQIDSLDSEKTDVVVQVESGMAGIFDKKHYQNPDLVGCETRHSTDWYKVICELADKGGGTIPHGAASSSGFGAATYPCYTARNTEGEVIFVAIDYLGDIEVDAQVGITHPMLPWKRLRSIYSCIQNGCFSTTVKKKRYKHGFYVDVRALFPSQNRTLDIRFDGHSIRIAVQDGFYMDNDSAEIDYIPLRYSTPADYPHWAPLIETTLVHVQDLYAKTDTSLTLPSAWVPKLFYAGYQYPSKAKETREVTILPNGGLCFVG